MKENGDRESFEAEYAKYQGLTDKAYNLWFERHRDGYTSSSVHASWWGFQAGAAWQRAQSAPAGSVPDGWRLVPAVPTAAMREALINPPKVTWHGTANGDTLEEYAHRAADAAIRAVLAAAPQPAPQQGDEVREAADILRNMIDSIGTHGNYSTESTLNFLNQALGSIEAALSAQGVGERT